MDRFLLSFFYTVLIVLTAPIFLPNWHLIFFAPFLVLSYYKKPYITCLWISLFSGLIIDLLSSQTRLGLYALNYSLTSWLLFKQKRHFFEDSLSTIPILTFLFAACSTFLHIPLYYFFDKPLSPTLFWVKTEIVEMSLWNACYAFLFFTLPALFLPKVRKRKTNIILHKSRSG